MKKLWPHIRSVIFLCVLAAVICVCDYLFAESGYIRFIFNQVKAENADTLAVAQLLHQLGGRIA
mgnify:CR=1 FL=1